MERPIVVADTGFVVALLNGNDISHQSVKAIYRQYSTVILPQTALVEVAYLVGQTINIMTVVLFLQGLSTSRFQVIPLIDSDIERTAGILEQYVDSRIDFVDATVMAVAERYNITTILTLDQRDFRLYRPRHCLYFDILP